MKGVIHEWSFRRNRWIAAAFLSLLILSPGAARAQKPDEAALQALWGEQQKAAGNYAEVAQDAAGFEGRFPNSPLVPVARGMAAWNYLEAGNFEDGRRVLEKMVAAGAEPVGAAGAEMARRWLTRLDREQVIDALQKVYAEDLEYPDALLAVNALAPQFRPPLADRWGAAWLYTPTSFKKLETGRSQTFVLESARLGEHSELKRALAAAYGAGFTYKPVKMMPPVAGKAVILFQNAEGSMATVAEGASASDLGLAYIGDEVLILSSGDYWAILPRPTSSI